MFKQTLQNILGAPAALVAVLVMAACGASVRTPAQGGGQAIPPNYPPTILETAEHREGMEAEWRRLFETLGIPAEGRKVPDLAPFTHTPQSLFGTGPIRLAPNGPQPDEERIRLLIRDFVQQHAQVLGVNANALSLEGVANAGASGNRYSYVQTDYPHPIVSPYGRLELIVTSKGDVIQMSDTAIPRLEMPTDARIAREAAAAKVVGMTFTYGDIAGRPQTVTVSNPSEISVSRLVIYPEALESALRLHLAWEVSAGSSLNWTVYVDAITGDVVGTKQNFQT